jgi:hypothetical protein
MRIQLVFFGSETRRAFLGTNFTYPPFFTTTAQRSRARPFRSLRAISLRSDSSWIRNAKNGSPRPSALRPKEKCYTFPTARQAAQPSDGRASRGEVLERSNRAAC